MIHTFTLNSAMEEVIYASSVDGEVIKDISKIETFYTGKAINTGLLLSNIGISLNMYIISGKNTFEDFLKFNNSNRRVFVRRVKGNTRLNEIIATPDKEIQIPRKGYFLSEVVADKLKEDLLKNVNVGDFVLIAGSLPRGISDTWYKDLIACLEQKGIYTFFDVSGNTLLEGLSASPFYAKPNEKELGQIIGDYDKKDLKEIVRDLGNKYNIRNFITSIGTDGAYGYNKDLDIVVHSYSKEVFNGNKMTSGCGDSFNAGFIYALTKDKDFLECMKFGVAGGGANILAGYPEKVTKDIILERLEFVESEIC